MDHREGSQRERTTVQGIAHDHGMPRERENRRVGNGLLSACRSGECALRRAVSGRRWSA